MTRAKEKLIIVSSDKYKDENEFNQKSKKQYIMQRQCQSTSSHQMQKYSDWLIPSIGISLNHWNFIPRFLAKTTVSDVIKEKQETIKVKNIDEMREKCKSSLNFIMNVRNPATFRQNIRNGNKRNGGRRTYTKSDVEYEPIYMMQKPDFMRTEKLRYTNRYGAPSAYGIFRY